MIWIPMKKRTTIAQMIVASHAINNPHKRCSSAGTVAVSSVHCRLEDITAITVLFACTPAMSMTGNQETG
jgi:hypothetical protein